MQDKLKITFLGTGTSQGIPVIGCSCKICVSRDARDKRLRSAVLIQYANSNVVIDAGPDFRQQMLNTGIRTLNAILITHEHKDHTTGLDDVRAFNRLSGKAVPIYCEEKVSEVIKNDFSYAFSEIRYPGIPEFDIRIINDLKPFKIAEEEFIPIRCMHNLLPVLGFRIRNFAYLTDLNAIPSNEIGKLQNLDVLVIDALRLEKHISHYSLDEAVDVVKQLKPKKAYLTHISHGLLKHIEVEKRVPENISPAYDGLEIFC